MHQDTKITIYNKLIEEKRDLNIYHHAAKGAFIISHGHSVTIPLTQKEEDYIHITIISGPGNLRKDCHLDIPAICDISFTSIGNGDIHHSKNRILFRIPPGPPIWQIKLTIPSPPTSHDNNGDKDYVTISGEISKTC
jgi:hypothetical protein